MGERQIGRYEVLGQLATGGMAEILLARLAGPSGFSRAVVLKRILPQLAGLPSFKAMFLDEARTLARIRHPNVVQIHELGEDAGAPFIVLEYVAGENLGSVLRRTTANGDRLEPALVAHVIAEACAGLHAAHEIVGDDGAPRNLVHRDVSPQNLFVDYDGHVKLLDFGVARTDDRIARTATGELKGKFDYMSPEQVSGKPVDRRSDLFSMGIVLYELVTGRRLFHRKSHLKTIEAILKEPVVPPSRMGPCPPELEAVILRALAKEPDDRYATAAEMRRDLLAVAREIPSPVETLAERMRRWFPDRIAEKDDMLRKVRDGLSVANVPPGETDVVVEVPEPPPYAPEQITYDPERLRDLASRPPPAAPSHAPLLAVAAAVAAVALVLIGLAVWRLRHASAEPAGTTPAPEPSAAGPDLTARADVLVRIESQPAGARVVVDGEDRGATPVDLHVPKDGAPLRVELRREGFAPAVQTVIPSSDQKLVLALAPAVPATAAPAPTATGGAGGARPRPRPSSPPAPAPSASGFRRFD